MGQKISILSFEWKCVKVVPNNIFIHISDCVTVNISKDVHEKLYFPYKSEQNCSHFQPNGLQDANQQQKPIQNHHLFADKRSHWRNFFSNVIPKTLTLIFSKWVFQLSNFKMLLTHRRIELLGQFFWMLVITSTAGYYQYLEIDFSDFVYDFSDRITNSFFLKVFEMIFSIF